MRTKINIVSHYRAAASQIIARICTNKFVLDAKHHSCNSWL